MLESVLRASGFKTGLYTSPHLVHFSERFRINNIQIPQEKLETYIRQIEAADDTLPHRPATFFEIATAIAFQYFADEAVDIAIIETGMGGRWDATNVVIPLLSVITHIDIDHTHFLGETIEQIAAEKAGIIKPNRPAITAPQPESVLNILRVATPAADLVSLAKIGTPQKLKIETPSRALPPIQLPLLGECQRENCAVAVAALEILADLLDFEPAYKKGLETVNWNARFQLLETDPPVILDGAHNPSAARALVKTLKENYPHHQIGFILGFLDDKDAAAFLHALHPLAAQIWTITIDGTRGTTAEQIAAQAHLANLPAIPINTLAEARRLSQKWLTNTPNRLLCITGSLHLPQLLQNEK